MSLFSSPYELKDKEKFMTNNIEEIYKIIEVNE